MKGAPAMRWIAIVAAAVIAPQLAIAKQAGHGQISPYVGQEMRSIKSLSEEDIAELRRGGGWGLAKAAELNGMPGPAHLLEMKGSIPLTGEQVSAIQEIYERMQADAIAEGERLIARERALEAAFQSRAITDEELRHLLAKIGESRTALRYIHLAAHLSTPALLTDEQINKYNALRGYGSDPCSNISAGHDAAMWRRHNGCN
jgi:Spy/CpxP family protein refolding chaperone